MARDDFSPSVKLVLQMRAASICSNPDCRRLTVSPSESDESKYIYIGKAAHITAASGGGPRYDSVMSPADRSSVSNGIFLCSNCADMIDKNNGNDFSVLVLKEWRNSHERWVASNLNKPPGSKGGDGGSGIIIGNRGRVIGGRGGNGGVGSGIAGKGGGGIICGDDAVIIGGDGGNCGTADGRGGKGARGPTERLGYPTSTWGFGRGGSGTDDPEYSRRITLLTKFRDEYRQKFPNDATHIDAGVEQVPADWINQRLSETGETWQVEVGPSGYVLPPLG